MTLPSIKDSAEAAWWKCQSAQELKDLNKERTNDRKPIQELVNAVKTGINELKKAIVAYDQRVSAKRSSTTSAAAGSKRKKQKTGVEPSFFDKALEQGSSMPFYSSLEEAKDKLDCNMPAIVRVADLVKPILAEDWLGLLKIPRYRIIFCYGPMIFFAIMFRCWRDFFFENHIFIYIRMVTHT